MIEGLKVTIPGTELKTLCETRAKFHEDRAKFYEQQKEALPDLDESVPAFSSAAKQPQVMMRERHFQHKAEAGELRFIGEHLLANEAYLLDRNDLAKLGIVARGY